MPYLPKEAKVELDASMNPEAPGELNYVITRLVMRYLGDRYNYHRLNDIIGCLEAAKLEFYRRVVVPYEEKKREENGDVY